MQTSRCVFASAAAVIAASGLAVAVPEYGEPEIVAGLGSVSHNVPEEYDLTNASPVINDAGVIAFRFFATARTGIWRGTPAGGEAVAELMSGDAFVYDPAIDAAGNLLWEQDAPEEGLYRYDAATDSVGFFSDMPFGATDWAGYGLLADGGVATRVTVGSDYAFALISPDGESSSYVATESGSVTFLAEPTVNSAGQFAARVFADGSVDQFRLYDPDGSFVTLARAGDPAPGGSTFNRFHNMAGLSDAGHAVFTGRVNAGNVWGLYFYDGEEVRRIARQNTGGFGSFDGSNAMTWDTPITADGRVAFRADLTDGRDVIAVWEDGETRIVVTEGDLITGTDGQTYEIGFVHPDGDPWTPFGGAPDMNEHGEIVFNAKVRNLARTATTGQAIFKVSPIVDDCVADWDGDEGVDVQDLLAYLNDFRNGNGDMDGGGTTDVQDLLAFLNAFRAGC